MQQVRYSLRQNSLLTVHTGNKSVSEPEAVAQDESSGDSGEEYVPKGDDSGESEDDEADVLDDDKSGQETTAKGKKKKKASQGSLRVAGQATQGKSVEAYGQPKHKAIDLQVSSR
jgi:hypothetical protein